MSTMDSVRRAPIVDVGQAEAASNGQSPRSSCRVFHLVDSLEVGTETQAVELALRMPVPEYQVTVGCLRAQGPLLSRMQDSAVAVEEFHPKGGIDSPRGVYQLLRLSGFLSRGKFDVVHLHDLWANATPVRDAMIAEDGFSPEKVRVIHNGVDSEKIQWKTGQASPVP